MNGPGPSAGAPLLEFRNVSLRTISPYDAGLQAVSFNLRPGEVALVRLAYGHTITPLADLASGLLDPAEGEVVYQGVAWTHRDAAEGARLRGGIGRVFERTGWVSNLDVDENITLARRYHDRCAPEAALQEARAIATALGLPGLPVGRPATVARQDLRRAEWVRALMGEPKLLLLERPGRELPLADLARLASEIERRRALGTAAIWLTDRPENALECGLRPTLKFNLEGGNMTAWS